MAQSEVPIPHEEASGGFHDARKRNAAYIRATGGTQPEAGKAAGVTKDTVGQWERGDDPEYWYWHLKFEDQDISRLGAEGRLVHRSKLRGRLSDMDDEARNQYCRDNNLSRWQFEQLASREEERVTRAAISATRVHAAHHSRRVAAQAGGGGGGQLGALMIGLLETKAELPPTEEIIDVDADFVEVDEDDPDDEK